MLAVVCPLIRCAPAVAATGIGAGTSLGAPVLIEASFFRSAASRFKELRLLPDPGDEREAGADEEATADPIAVEPSSFDAPLGGVAFGSVGVLLVAGGVNSGRGGDFCMGVGVFCAGVGVVCAGVGAAVGVVRLLAFERHRLHTPLSALGGMLLEQRVQLMLGLLSSMECPSPQSE